MMQLMYNWLTDSAEACLVVRFSLMDPGECDLDCLQLFWSPSGYTDDDLSDWQLDRYVHMHT